MTEHSASVFVFFFLAEYASIVLMCILISILFLGGYLLVDISPLLTYLGYLVEYVELYLDSVLEIFFQKYYYFTLGISEYRAYIEDVLFRVLVFYFGVFLYLIYIILFVIYDVSSIIMELVSIPDPEGYMYGYSLGFKTSMLIFIFI